MAFGLTKSRVSPIGIDFGVDSVKLLQVVPGDPPSLITGASELIPEEARTKPAERHAFLVEAIKRLLKSGGFKGRKAICSMPAYQTLIQQVQIPKEQHDIEQQIGLHLRQRMNIDPSRMVIRHVPVGQVIRDGSPKQEVICIAAGRETVMRHIETAHRAKLTVVGMHAETAAILKAFEHLYRRAGDDEHTTCFIDIGAATTKVIIAHGKHMVFAKTIHAAGDHLTRALATQKDVGFTEARAMRCGGAAASNAQAMAAAATGQAVKHDGSPSERPTGFASMGADTATDSATGPALHASIVSEKPLTERPRHQPASHQPGDDPFADTLDVLTDELQMCIRYHQSMFPGRLIEKLVFLGGESHHKDICQRIARELRIGAQLGDPLARVNKGRGVKGNIDLRQPQPGWAVPLGLCLSEANL